MKVVASLEDDLRRGRLTRHIIDDPKNYPAGMLVCEEVKM